MALTRTQGKLTRFALAISLSLVFTFFSTLVASANVTLTRISTDTFTNSTSQHATEVEPDTFSFGSTIVSAFQVGRFNNGGSSDIGWATSTDGGSTWTHGFLPITVFSGGPYDRVSDASVAYDAAHNTWIISSLALVGSSSVVGAAVIVNRSTDGGLTWGANVIVHNAVGSENLDKNWTVCDDTVTSPFYGHCYTEWDDNGGGNLIHMSTSTDGGLNWGAQKNTANNATGLGGQPVVQPNGTVIVPIDNANETALLAFKSTDGGVSWSSTVSITTIKTHTVAGNLRSGPLPSAEIDGTGKVYVVWQDCRFERRCAANDIVMTTSTDGATWSTVTRIPIGSTGSGVDHFIPGFGVDKATSGTSAHLGLAYYYYPTANCSASTCQLNVGYVSSTNGGTSWTVSTQLAGPMNLSWLPNTTQGLMVGDYISTSFSGSTAHPVLSIANAPTGSVFDEAMYSPASGLAAAAGGSFVSTPKGEQAVPNAASDHAASNSAVTHR